MSEKNGNFFGGWARIGVIGKPADETSSPEVSQSSNCLFFGDFGKPTQQLLKTFGLCLFFGRVSILSRQRTQRLLSCKAWEGGAGTSQWRWPWSSPLV